MTRTTNIVDKIIAFESGEMSDNDTLDFFASMVKDGTVWELQGRYGRTAAWFIQNGYISRSGKVLKRFPETAANYTGEQAQ